MRAYIQNNLKSHLSCPLWSESSLKTLWILSSELNCLLTSYNSDHVFCLVFHLALVWTLHCNGWNLVLIRALNHDCSPTIDNMNPKNPIVSFIYAVCHSYFHALSDQLLQPLLLCYPMTAAEFPRKFWTTERKTQNLLLMCRLMIAAADVSPHDNCCCCVTPWLWLLLLCHPMTLATASVSPHDICCCCVTPCQMLLLCHPSSDAWLDLTLP